VKETQELQWLPAVSQEQGEYVRFSFIPPYVLFREVETFTMAPEYSICGVRDTSWPFSEHNDNGNMNQTSTASVLE
jgi:hypothetical protein